MLRQLLIPAAIVCGLMPGVAKAESPSGDPTAGFASPQNEPSDDPECGGWTVKECTRYKTTGCQYDLADPDMGCRAANSIDADEIAATHPCRLVEGAPCEPLTRSQIEQMARSNREAAHAADQHAEDIPLPRAAPLRTCEEMGMRSGAPHPRGSLPDGSLSGPFFTCEPATLDWVLTGMRYHMDPQPYCDPRGPCPHDNRHAYDGWPSESACRAEGERLAKEFRKDRTRFEWTCDGPPAVPKPTRKAAPDPEAPALKYRASLNLNLRASPDATSANLLGRWSPDYIPQGTIFVGKPGCILAGAGAGWCKVTFSHHYGVITTGWVNGWYLEKTVPLSDLGRAPQAMREPPPMPVPPPLSSEAEVLPPGAWPPHDRRCWARAGQTECEWLDTSANTKDLPAIPLFGILAQHIGDPDDSWNLMIEVPRTWDPDGGFSTRHAGYYPTEAACKAEGESRLLGLDHPPEGKPQPSFYCDQSTDFKGVPPTTAAKQCADACRDAYIRSCWIVPSCWSRGTLECPEPITTYPPHRYIP